MSRFVRIQVDLRHLGSELLALVPNLGDSNISNHSLRTGVMLSTMSETNNDRELATALIVDMALPQAVLPPNAALDASVLSAGQVGLGLVRTELASAGFPNSALHKISIKHVSLKSMSVTYMLRFDQEHLAFQFKRRIRQHGLLLGLFITSSIATSRTEYRDSVHSAASTSAHAENSELSGVMVSIDYRLTGKSVRLDVILEEDYLQRQGWDSVGGWHSASASERYKAIFSQAVRGMFRLDGGRQPHPAPSEITYARLGVRNEQLLREYISGKDPMNFSGFPFTHRGVAHSTMRGWYTAQEEIIEQTGVNIKKPWQEYQWHRPIFLVKNLIHPHRGPFKDNGFIYRILQELSNSSQ